MPATIHWKPIVEGGTIEGGNSGVVDTLMHEFGADFARRPLILDRSYLERLMEIAENYGTRPNPFEHLVSLVIEHGAVIITTSH